MFNLREARTQRMLGRITGGLWVLLVQAGVLAAVGNTIGGEWSRVIVLGLLILAGIGTLLLGMAQTCIPMHDAWRMGWEARDRQDETGRAGIVELRERQPAPRQLHQAVPAPVRGG